MIQPLNFNLLNIKIWNHRGTPEGHPNHRETIGVHNRKQWRL